METTVRRKHPGHAALRRGRSSCAGQIYHLTITTKARVPIFRDFEAACAASRCFEDMVVLGDATLMAWVLMPDHAHWLLQLGEQHPLPGVVNRLKSASARSANAVLGRTGPIWNRAFHDHAVRSDEDLRVIARYIIANPVRAGLASRVGYYPFWNAIWL